MLAGVSDDEDAVSGADLIQEVAHLPSAGEAGLIEQIEMAAGRIGWSRTPARKETLQRVGRDAGLTQLVGSLGGGSETLNGVAAFLSSLSDRGERRGLARAGEPLHSLNAIARRQDVLDSFTLSIVQLRARECQLDGRIGLHDWFGGVLAEAETPNRGSLHGHRLGCGELATGCVLGSVDRPELAGVDAPVEVPPYGWVGYVAHAAAERVAHE